jgi:CSLREA domain-containing protein
LSEKRAVSREISSVPSEKSKIFRITSREIWDCTPVRAPANCRLIVKTHSLFLLIGIALFLFAAHPAGATIRTVTNLNDSGAGSLRQAIVNSASGDTINFAVTGAITLTSGELQINHDLTISGPGSANLTITRSSSSKFRIFFFDNGTWNLSFLTISNGYDASAGGGIYNANGNLTVAYCVISNNRGDQGGGGILNKATMTVQNCTISGNAGGGGPGGGIYNYQGGALTVNACTFYLNTASKGGALYNDKHPGPSITHSTFDQNLASYGGGIYNDFGDMTLEDCTFSGNTAPNGGGAILNGLGLMTIKSCTISGNDSTGGAILNYDRVSLGNTILNRTSAGENLFNVGSATGYSLGYNLSNDNSGGFLTGPGDKLNTDPKLDPAGLQDNGGTTMTIALTSGSPAIDQGDSLGLTTDQRGSPRVFENLSVPNAADGADIGAYEAGGDPVQGGSNFVVTTTDDHDDGTCGGTDCSLREAIARANNLPGANTIIFARNLSGAITLTMGELVVTDSLTITGTPIGTIRNSSLPPLHPRVFSFTGGSSTLIGLTIQNGINQINNFLGQTNTGGGIYNSATLSLYGCAFTNNHVLGGSNAGAASGGKGEGGAIYNSGTLLVDGSSFSQSNEAIGGGGGNGNFGHGGVPSGSGGAGQGGAIFNDTGGSLTVTNSTFSQSMALGGNGGSGGPSGGNGGNGDGAAIFNLGTMTITSATVSGNSGSGGTPGTGGSNGKGSGGLTTVGGTSTVANTISAGNTGSGAGPDVDGAFTSQGYNLIGIGDFSSGFTAIGDQMGTTAAPVKPRLGPLQYNGGGTYTMALLSNSPAIDQGKSFGLTTDQRGRARTLDTSTANASGGDGTDIGAFELGGGLGPFAPVSRKFHGGNTNPFDVPLPLTGPIGVECRRNTGGDTTGLNVGRDHEVVLTFASNLTRVANVAVKDSNNNTIPSTFTVTNNVVTIDLHSVPNAPRRLSLKLSGVSDGTDKVNIQIPMGVLAGDTTGDGTVNSSDISLTKSKSGQTVGSSNFREDVTLDGSLNSSDISLVKSKSGTALP